MIEEELRKLMIGRTITDVRMENLDARGDEAADILTIGFTDGTAVRVRTQDYEGYSSWLVLLSENEQGRRGLADRLEYLAKNEACLYTADANTLRQAAQSLRQEFPICPGCGFELAYCPDCGRRWKDLATKGEAA